MQYERTCAEQCWYAREDVCKCACDGAKHGCLLINGAPAPGRTRRVRDTRYRLHAVMDWREARDMERHLFRGNRLEMHWAFQVVPKDCKWPEAVNAAPGSMFVWIKAEVPEAQAAAEMIQARFVRHAEDVQYHRENCNGTAYAQAEYEIKLGRAPRPCNNAPAHLPLPDVDAWIAAQRCWACDEGKHERHYDDYWCKCPETHADDGIVRDTDPELATA